MNKSNLFKSFGIVFLTTLTFLFSCKKGLNDRQKVFLDYAKLEDTYNNTGYYHNLDLYNNNVDDPRYTDSAFNINTFKANLKKTFKLISDNNGVQPDFEGPALQYPHQYEFKPQKDGSIHVNLSVFVPQTFYKFSFDKDDIGKTITKDSAEITLLDMTNDGVTLMVENKSVRHSYDYTYDNVDKKDFNEKKDADETNQLGYGKYLFISESVESPNAEKTITKDSILSVDFARLNISLSDEHGKTLLSDGRIGDFRHYLWYRNHDMPYPELVSAYSDLKFRYKEKEVDSLHKFNPIDIINIKASGKIGRVEFFLRSAKGHIETIDLGNQIPAPQQRTADLRVTENKFLPIENITKENVNQLLKVNYTSISVKNNEPDYFLVYAAVPNAYNNKQMSMDFSDLKIIGDKKDTVIVNDVEDAKNNLNNYLTSEINNLYAVKFKSPNEQATKIIGKIDLIATSYLDKEFKVSKLPKGIALAPDGLTVIFSKNEPVFEDLVEIYAFEGTDKQHAIPYTYPETDADSAKDFALKYLKKPATIIIRYKKATGTFEQQVPFELVIPKKQK